jgi:hypothetical protein
MNGEGRQSPLPSRRCRIVGWDRVKARHVTTGKGKRGKDLFQAPAWPRRETPKIGARRLASSCDGKGRNLEQKCSAGGLGG